jgi:hypothetical protein
LAGKAYLLFQKYLKVGAYRQINVCPNEMISKMDAELTEATQETPTVEIQNSFFDEAVAIVEDVMADHLFKPFFASEFFEKYPITFIIWFYKLIRKDTRKQLVYMLV